MQFHDVANIFPEMRPDEFASLKASIQKNGQRVLIETYEGLIIDGRHRYKACVELGIEPQFKEWDGKGSLCEHVRIMNAERRHLNTGEKQMAAARYAIEEEKEAKARSGFRTDLTSVQICTEVRSDEDFGYSRTKAAEKFGIGERSVASAVKVAKHGDRSLQQAVEAGEVAVSVAAVVADLPVEEQREIVAKGEAEILKTAKEIQSKKREKKRAEVLAKLEDINTKTAKELAGHYDVIVIDPPWPMEKIERDVAPNQIHFDYPTMSEEEMADMIMPAADSCHLWLWTTHKFLPMAFRLLDAWEFKYVCTFVWHKPGGFQPYGLPQYNCEFALYARRGAPSFIDTKALPVCFEAPRGKHSEKPEAFYDVVRRVTAGRRIDIFNRRAIEGFDTWGKEASE